MLARLGVGTITIVDGDIFSDSNLNRQLYFHENSLGKSKARMAKERINIVNPLVTINAFIEFLKADNANKILKNHHVIVDALDNITTRRLVQNYAEQCYCQVNVGNLFHTKHSVNEYANPCLFKVYSRSTFLVFR